MHTNCTLDATAQGFSASKSHWNLDIGVELLYIYIYVHTHKNNNVFNLKQQGLTVPKQQQRKQYYTYLYHKSMVTLYHLSSQNVNIMYLTYLAHIQVYETRLMPPLA